MAKVIYALLFILISGAAYAACETCHADSIHYNDFSCTTCHSGNSGTSRMDLAHYRIMPGKYAKFLIEDNAVEAGRKLIDENSCRRCHIIKDEGNANASNLDDSIKRLTAQEIADLITTPNEQMPVFNFDDRQIESLVNSLLRDSFFKESGSIVQVAHFAVRNNTGVYDKNCGGCHMMLSADGALGRKSSAPFLTGLYTKYYPEIDAQKWDENLLTKWLKNPRHVKKNAVMPIAELTEKELADLLRLFEVKE